MHDILRPLAFEGTATPIPQNSVQKEFSIKSLSPVQYRTLSIALIINPTIQLNMSHLESCRLLAGLKTIISTPNHLCCPKPLKPKTSNPNQRT